jgi:hypothetical protein
VVKEENILPSEDKILTIRIWFQYHFMLTFTLGLVGMIEDGTVSAMEELYEYGMGYRKAVASPLTDTDRESIMELAVKSGFEVNWAAELAATPKAFWTFVEALLAQRS